MKPERFFNGYLQTYVERDVRALISLKELNRFQQFPTLLAGRIGQVINYTSLSNDIGVSATTIKNWISVLKASYVVLVLLPRKARIDAPGVLHQIKGFVSKLEEICPEVTRCILQQDLTN